MREAAIRWEEEDSAGIFLFWVGRLRWVEGWLLLRSGGRRAAVAPPVREAANRWEEVDSAGIVLFWVDRLRSVDAGRRADRRWRAPGVAAAARENET